MHTPPTAARPAGDADPGFFGTLTQQAGAAFYRMALPSGRYEYLSVGITALTGCTPEEFRATPLLIRDLLHPDSRAYFEQAWEKLLAGDMPPVYEYAIVDRSGTTRWLRQENALVRDAAGRACAIEGVVVDVTHYRRREAELQRGLRARNEELERTAQKLRDEIEAHARALTELRDREARLRLLTDHLPELISYVDAEERYRYNNLTYQVWFGRAPEAILGKTLREVLGDAAYASIEDRVRAALSGRAVTFETEVPYAQGGTRYVRASYVPHRDDEAAPVKGFFALVSDVSDRKRAEAAERRHLDELAHAERLASMGEMASEITHELTQPLTSIAHYSEACLRVLGRGEPESVAAIAAAMRDQSRQALETVQHLRRLVRRRPAEMVRADMRRLVNSAVQLIGREAAARGFVIRVEAAEALPAVNADAVLIEQVILNLLRNAMDAATGLSPPAPDIELRLSSGEGWLQVAVLDRGRGLTPDGKTHLFEPFYTTKATGLGLGLAICRRIIESHGGSLWAADNPSGQGAMFCFRLPSARRRGAQKPSRE